MTTNLENFYETLMLSISNRSLASNSDPDQIFFEDSMKVLIDDGHSFESDPDIKDAIGGGYQYTPYRDRGLRIDGYEHVPDRGLLNLYLCHYSDSYEIKSITKTEINQLISNLGRFYTRSLDENFSEDFKYVGNEEAYEVSNFIFGFESKVKQIKIVIITNTILSKTIDSLSIEKDEWINQTETLIDVWDIRRFYNNEATRGEAEAIKINFNADFDFSIPTLSAHLDTSDYQSYLCVMPGDVIAELYKKYGARLLEANVRSFLQFRAKVNQGMRNTLKNNPDLFFAFNNGITATADNCILDENGNIKELTNLQIVNGGQTTATMYFVKSKGFSDLKGVFVQMKLSVIKNNEETEDLVSNISRFANTQNKISESDFFSNHPFHRTIEGKSRRILMPKKPDQIRETKWFYERSRGQYQNELGTRSGPDKKLFQEQYPKTQLITKTDLAKVAIIFDGGPNHAVKGAQAAFKKFATDIQKVWEGNHELINDLFYKKLISQQILYNQTRVLVMKEVSGNSIQPVTAYALHMLNTLSSDTQHSLNYFHIWEKGIYKSLEVQLVKIIEYVVEFFERNVAGVEGKTTLSFSKINGCLIAFNQSLEKLGKDYLDGEYLNSLKSIEEISSENKKAKSDQKVEDENTIVIKFSKLDWDKVVSYARTIPEISEDKISLLLVFPTMYKRGRVPSTKQIFAINNIVNSLVDEGLDI
jgi:hypothetical protein